MWDPLTNVATKVSGGRTSNVVVRMCGWGLLICPVDDLVGNWLVGVGRGVCCLTCVVV